MAIRIDAAGDDLRRTSGVPDESALTICGWSYVTADRGVATYQALGGIENTGDGSWNILYWEGGTDGSMAISSGAAETNLASRPALNTWFFWALTSTTAGAGSLIGYWSAVNSSTFVSASTTGQAMTPNLLIIGNDSVGSWLNGRFANIKVWDAVLTQTELEQEKWSVRPRRFANLHLWAPCRIASELFDYSGNGRTLTATGTLTTEDGPPVPWGANSIVVPFAAAVTPTVFVRIVSPGSGPGMRIAGNGGLAA